MVCTKRDEPFLGRLDGALSQLAPPAGQARGYAVAFSGGVDSTVLLTALCRLPARAPLRALHVDHGLVAGSDAWARHCAAAAAALGVPYVARRVRVARGGGASVEAAAREARYAALAAMLEPGEILLTAHHADDQLETVLLRLLRGAGVEGLAATRALAPFARGYLARPLLDFSRAEIRRQAEQWQLRWLDDPSNEDLRFDRNFLRRKILPLLRERWPAAGRNAARLARQMQDAEAVLAAMAEHDLGPGAVPARLPLERLRALPAPRQRNLLRYSIRCCDLPTPTAAQLQQLCDGLRVTRPDAETRVAWPGAEARIYRQHLYLLAPPVPLDVPGAAAPRVMPGRPWSGAAGRVELVPADDAGLPGAWLEEGLEIRFRHGGERLKPLGRAHSRPLKKWLQDAGIVPWMRERIPLLYRQDELVAVADLWLTDAARDAPPGQRRWRVAWTEHAPLH